VELTLAAVEAVESLVVEARLVLVVLAVVVLVE
jgi:hypothetical protein